MPELHPEHCEEFKPWPTFEQLAPVLAPKLAKVDICGHNIEFDKGFIVESMIRSGINFKFEGHTVDTLMIARLKMAHTLENVYRRLVNPNGFSGAHDAANDVAACEQVLAAQLNEFQDLPRTVADLSDFCFRKKDAIDKDGKFLWISGEPCVGFGAKHRGKTMKQVYEQDRGYYRWMMNGSFAVDTKALASEAAQGRFPEKPSAT